MNEPDRRKVTFEQAEGLEPLPTQLKPKELSAALRARLWYVLHHGLKEATHHSEFDKPTIEGPWLTILFEMHIFRFHKPADEFRPYAKPLIEEMKSLIMNGSYSQVFGTIQWILRRPQCPHDLPKVIATVLRSCQAGYRLTDDGRTLLPIASEEEAQIAEQAFAALNRSEYGGARKHLTVAAERLSSGDSAGGVREAMQAVESVARVITNKKTFSEALLVLEKQWQIHGALKEAFSRLYGYTGDEEGIRHPLLDDPNASVDEADALFMFGACAAFVSYLIGKAQTKVEKH